nr:ROK family transcriptional regulator [Kibdelosporangium sp. MJ126-NF4]CEL18117.1 ROK-family transcriptional regulator [Kibdelosporangium sp. MJ126-NF4]CTQ90654.1 ROK-family transcriptional regulator [Kibdelosporangium sp. MJ126-NF4]
MDEHKPQTVNLAAMRWHNLGAILRAIRDHGPVPRAELTRLTGISSGTTTKLTASLVSAGVIHEAVGEDTDRATGRPRVPLDLHPATRAVLAAHIGLQRTMVAAVDLRAHTIAAHTVDHRSEQWRHVLTQAIGELEALRAGLGERRVLGVGITTGGQVDHRAGILRSQAGTTWHDVDVREPIADKLGLPVEYDHAVRGASLAELRYGMRGHAEDILNLFVGNTIGVAMVIAGALHHGARDRAGTVAHLPVAGARGPRCACGRGNCFEALTSNLGILELGRNNGIVGPGENYDALLTRARDGDADVRRLLRRRATWVGEAITVLADLVDPEVVVLTGNATEWDGFLPAVRRATDADLSARIRLPSLQPHSPTTAPAALILDRYFLDPVPFEPELASGSAG